MTPRFRWQCWESRDHPRFTDTSGGGAKARNRKRVKERKEWGRKRERERKGERKRESVCVRESE